MDKIYFYLYDKSGKLYLEIKEKLIEDKNAFMIIERNNINNKYKIIKNQKTSNIEIERNLLNQIFN